MSLADNTPPLPDAEKLSDYYERKVAGVCTRRGCPQDACADSALCSAHWEDEKARKRKSDATRREALRQRKRCVSCGKKSARYRCAGCLRASADHETDSADNTRARTEQRTVAKVETDGRTRYRYTGQGKRGRTSKIDETRMDIGEAMKTLERAIEGFEVLDTLGGEAQKSAARAAIMQVRLAQRFGDEVIERYAKLAGVAP